MLRILDITSPDINNGNGLRVTIWVAGCKHYCKGCHNEWTWDYNKGKLYEYSQNEIKKELYERLNKDYIQGLTFSGGDPLCQDNDGLCAIYGIIQWFREEFPEKDIWLYTGYTKEQIDNSHNCMMKEVVNNIDVLVDGPYIEELRDIAHTPFRGSTNQKIINIK